MYAFGRDFEPDRLPDPRGGRVPADLLAGRQARVGRVEGADDEGMPRVEIGDPVAGGDHAPDRAGRAPAGAAVPALEHRADARVPERRPGGRPDDAVGGQPVGALEALDGALGGRAEDAVGRDAERALDERHAAAAVRRREVAAPGVGALERRPGGGADDAVGRQPVAALEALDRAPGGGAVDVVGREVEPALDRGHLGAAIARLEVAGARRGGQREQRERDRQRGGVSVTPSVHRLSGAYEVS